MDNDPLPYNGSMTDVCAPFRDKNITLLGLGLLGRGVGDAAFLAECGARVVVTDKKSEHELAESVAKLKNYSSITFHLGGHRAEDFENADLVIKAAGVPLNSPEIALAKKHGVPVAMSTALFAKSAMEMGATIVGVTGTRGKSTVTHMIFHVLQRAGKSARLGGNVRGISTLAMLPEIKSGDICVLELDSWQLQGFGDVQISPQVAVFTNLMADHQNYYPNEEAYFADKANIFTFQKSGDTLIVGPQVFEKVHAARPQAAPHIPEALPVDWALQIPGEHNRENAALAAQALRALGVSDDVIKDGLATFAGVEGRLQFLREVHGVKIYNDNNATTPEATIAALRALGENITLIVGGSEKNLPIEALVSEIKQRVSNVVLLTHEHYKGSARLANDLRANAIPFVEVHSLREAIERALAGNSPIILFSPAFASFGMFKNEYDRNDEFVRLVASL